MDQMSHLLHACAVENESRPPVVPSIHDDICTGYDVCYVFFFNLKAHGLHLDVGVEGLELLSRCLGFQPSIVTRPPEDLSI